MRSHDHGHSRRSSWRRYGLSALGPLLVLGLVLRFARLDELQRLIVDASPWWLAGALICKLLTPCGTAAIYQRVLRLLGYHIRLGSLWLTAQAAALVNIVMPAGPLAASVVLLRAFRRHGVPEGSTTIAIVLDALTYELVFGSLVGVGLGYVLIQGRVQPHEIGIVMLLIGGLVAGIIYLWRLQRDRDALTCLLLRVCRWLARRLRRTWSEAALLRFLDELYCGKALIGQRPREVVWLLGYQIGSVALDVLTLFCAFQALGSGISFAGLVLSYGLASVFAAIAPLPGGGGSFEGLLVLLAAQSGSGLEAALGATLIYRTLTFWLPLGLIAAAYPRLTGAPLSAVAPARPHHVR